MLTTLITLKDLGDLKSFTQFLFWEKYQWVIAVLYNPNGPTGKTYYMVGDRRFGNVEELPEKLYLLPDGDTLEW